MMRGDALSAPAQASSPIAQLITCRWHPTSSPLGSPISLHGHTYKVLVAPAGPCVQPQHPRPKTDSTEMWDCQSVFQKEVMATNNTSLEVFEFLQDKAYCKEAPEDTSDVEMTQKRMDQVR